MNKRKKKVGLERRKRRVRAKVLHLSVRVCSSPHKRKHLCTAYDVSGRTSALPLRLDPEFRSTGKVEFQQGGS